MRACLAFGEPHTETSQPARSESSFATGTHDLRKLFSEQFGIQWAWERRQSSRLEPVCGSFCMHLVFEIFSNW